MEKFVDGIKNDKLKRLLSSKSDLLEVLHGQYAPLAQACNSIRNALEKRIDGALIMLAQQPETPPQSMC